MPFAAFVVLCLEIIWFFPSQASCSMHRTTVNRTSGGWGVCSDGSTPIYYISRNNSTKWVIFLESGGGCFDYASCLNRKNQEPYLYGTGLYPREIFGEDILSSSDQNNLFYRYNKVLVPYCSNDLWLGNKTITFRNAQGRTLPVSFHGEAIFRAIIDDLNPYGLINATEIWLAGSSAGGIGVLNHAKFVRRKYRAKIYALTDSSWFVNYQNMLANEALKKLISEVSTVPGCSDTTLHYPCCLSIFCMVSKRFFPRDVQLFNILSRYDIYSLSKGIILSGKLTSFDKTSQIVSDMLAFGGEISHSLRVTSSIPNMLSIIASCFQHTFFATSSLWSPGGLFNSRSETSFKFPLFVFRHIVKKGRWNKVAVKGKTINKILQNWYEASIVSNVQSTRNGSDLSRKEPTVLSDSCRRVQCNPTCPKSIEFYSEESPWPKWAEWLLLILYLIFTLICVTVKVFWLVQRIRETRIQNQFIDSLYNNTNTLKAVGLPCCIPSNYIGLSCMDVEYSVTAGGHKRQVNDGRNRWEKLRLRIRGKGGVDAGKEKRQILKGINAYFNPGQLVAIMGPSGSGKTTLLDILTGRKDSKESKVFINGLSNSETREWFKSNSGYVMQLATPYYEELTVRENLTFSALMRLPKTMSIKNKLMRVEQVIGQTGLNDYADVVVGSAVGPGLSGGQKRRLCVAVQLLRVPSVLFLDEPTSGLDSASSLELLETLHGLTLSGRLVILTIHQPRIEIFHMFDRILFLCGGHVAYYGSPIMAPTMIAEALKSSGEVLDASNPADTIMDVLVFKKSQEMIVEHYQESGEIEAIKKAVQKATKNPVKTLSMKIKRYSSSLSDRLLAFDCRSSKCQTTAQKLYLLIIFLLYGLALGSVYWQTDSGILLMSCYQVFLCASQLFMASVIHTHLGKAFPLFALEQAEGVGKSRELVLHTFIRIAAVTVLPLFLSCTIIYLCTVTELDFWKFFVTTLIHLQLNHVWIAIIMLSASAIPRYSTLICPMLSAVSGFAGGFLVPEPEMPAFYYWLFYVNPTHWAYSATMKVLINDVIFDCSSQSKLECQSNMGIAVLQQFGFEKVNPYQNMTILLAMLIVFLLSTMILLEVRYKNKMKKWSRAMKRAAVAGKSSFSQLFDRLFKDSESGSPDKQRLFYSKDVEANGDCGRETKSLLAGNPYDSLIKDKSLSKRRQNDSDPDLYPLLLPVEVEPMLTARVRVKERPKTISVFTSSDLGEENAKKTPVSRSSSFTCTDWQLKVVSTASKQSEPTVKQSKFRRRNAVQLPGIVIEDAGVDEDNGHYSTRRERSDTCETEPDSCLSRYLDTILKSHEVYCSVSGGRPKSSRRRSVTKRLPDEVKRSESVHIQRKASMLILAERRKSMTAQITGFGQAFTYLNEIGMDRKPVARKNMSVGAKRKVEIRKQQRTSDGSLRSSGGSNEHLKVPDSLPVSAVSPVEIRRSRMLHQFAIDIPDENSNCLVGKQDISPLYQDSSNFDEKVPSGDSGSIQTGFCNEFKQSGSLRDPIRKSSSGQSSRNSCGKTVEPIKISALKISRKKFVPLKDHADDHVRGADRFDAESRSSVCRTPLGSIDETEEDEEYSVADLERRRAVLLRRGSLQKAQQNHHFSENFSEITKWLRQSSQVLNEDDELSDDVACHKNTSVTPVVLENEFQLDSEQDDAYDAEIDAEISRAFAQDKIAVTAPVTDESTVSSEGPKSSDSGIRSGFSEYIGGGKYLESKCSKNSLQNATGHEPDTVVATSTKASFIPVPSIVVTTGSTSPRSFSNALFLEEHGTGDAVPQRVTAKPLPSANVKAIKNDISLEAKHLAWETRSNEEFSTDGYDHIERDTQISADYIVLENSAASEKLTNFRRSSSCEFDFDGAEANVDLDITRIRSLRRKCKKRKMETKSCPKAKAKSNKDYEKLGETVL